jgi:predicted nuclease of restriction endonuclease-like RecB superfamily
MLPLELLRTKITNKGKRITPLFCLPSADNLLLSKKLITEFHFSNNKKETKGELQKRLFLYENSYDDFKLIRGLIILLERRCIFKINQFIYSEDKTHSFVTQLPSSFSLRKVLFEESSKDGLPLDHTQREKIFQNVASKLDIDTNYIEKLMWLDQDDYLILESFSSIEPMHLLGIYNLAILQTLLFNSVNFEFTVKGGTNWKQVLRTIKRNGLMYNLQKVHKNLENNFSKETQFNKHKQDIISNDDFKSYFNDDIICFIDGPLSIFKLTNKYGVLIAKVIPKIISSHKWNIKASIIKNSISGRKLYEFNLSSDSDIYIFNAINDRFQNNYQFEDSNDNNLNFDSSVETKFATQFEKYRTGWKLIREPDPLILPNGRAFIPDFLFEKYDKRIYFEIIGFWTPQYLERKFKKIHEIIKTNEGKYDLLIAINENNFVSESTELKKLLLSNSMLNDNSIIVYKKDSIPMKKLLFCLKSIESKIMNQNLERYRTAMEDYIVDLLNNNYEIINLEEISKVYDVSINSLSDIISNLRTNVHLKNYIIQNSLLISKKKLNKIKDEIGDIDNLIKIQEIFENNNIPVQYTIDTLKHIGFEILWRGMDSSNIIIKRKV